MKKISKVIIYYEDGTYEEVKAGIPDTQGKQNKETVSPSPVIPDFRPDTQKVRDYNPAMPYQPTWTPYYTQPARDTWPYPWRPNDIWCTNSGNLDNMPLNLKYTVNSDTGSWTFTSTGNADNLNKYTITSTGNGNVDLSK